MRQQCSAVHDGVQCVLREGHEGWHRASVPMPWYAGVSGNYGGKAPEWSDSDKSECCHGLDDVCAASGCLMGIVGGEDG